MALIPFEIDNLFAQNQAQTWVIRRLATPNDLVGIVAKAQIARLYAPFWIFDSEEAVQYWAHYTVGSGDNRQTIVSRRDFARL